MNSDLPLIVTACIAWFTAGLIAGWTLCRRKCLQILAVAMCERYLDQRKGEGAVYETDSEID
jgi:hypothetical protein